MNIQISNDDALTMLIERVKFWTSDHDIRDLYTEMYTEYIEGGVFDGTEFNAMTIVDNDYINYCTVIDDTDPHFNEIMRYAANYEWDISCEHLGYSHIEAFDKIKGLILVRY